MLNKMMIAEEEESKVSLDICAGNIERGGGQKKLAQK